ncbi:hypothetical protein HWV23_10965 [Natronomonas halophila]|uniref:DUF7383 domain-containing protein n=1 Tax=Natronomonas halophila TaxID=2747817 RepID=UPI0015B6A881|nr:hypothetical protein [Natronomonas halophila]QLD86220.1 hypothetical protein HWV23_10965 [Natronomonas halophila]
MSRRANYALVHFSEQLGPNESALDVPWAEYTGDETTEHTFEVPAEPSDAYLELQAYEVGAFGHEIYLNGEPVTGFDIPPADGWQYWMDAVTGAELTPGENTIRVAREDGSRDNFAVGNVVVNWKEPVE